MMIMKISNDRLLTLRLTLKCSNKYAHGCLFNNVAFHGKKLNGTSFLYLHYGRNKGSLTPRKYVLTIKVTTEGNKEWSSSEYFLWKS